MDAAKIASATVMTTEHHGTGSDVRRRTTSNPPADRTSQHMDRSDSQRRSGKFNHSSTDTSQTASQLGASINVAGTVTAADIGEDESTDMKNSSPNLMSNPNTSNFNKQMDGSYFGSPESMMKLKREKLKVQKKVYRKEKKRAAKEILSTLRDPSVVLMADYLKVRGMLKSWTKFWCVLKPGVLILYKSQKQKSSHWVGTIVLNSAKLIERPSKKDGFCFKIYHPLDQSIWAQKGPQGETIGAITQPLMYSSAIFRAPSETAGKTWMDALELALKCSSLLLRTAISKQLVADSGVDEEPSGVTSVVTDQKFPDDVTDSAALTENELNDSDRENHFKDYMKGIGGHEETSVVNLKDGGAKTEGATDGATDEDSESSGSDTEDEVSGDDHITETLYIKNDCEDVQVDGASLTEEFADDNKNIIWTLMKQVRPGMDLSKVVLPTFILEPRSLLEKFADYYYHCDILSGAAKCDDALTRMIEVVRWYVSGFYKTPRGVKKPYNPILGETFRCYWKNEQTGSRTFYIAEQLSHHPPVSAFFITNRKDGFSICCSVLAKSKFYGNSVAANMEGVGKLTFMRLGEEYTVTLPYGYAKGIIVGSLTMELGGKIHIECEKTGYKTELEFKLKPFMGGSDSTNKISGKIKLGHETLFSLDGRWDQEIFIKDRSTGVSSSFWKINKTTLARRLPRFTVPMENQTEFESERLWQHVSEALRDTDQEKATHEKWLLEEEQRKSAKERKLTNTAYSPRLFEQDQMTGSWIYKYSDIRPWDPVNDIMQYENDYKVMTNTKHKTPLVRSMSVVNVNGDKSTRRQKARNSKRNTKVSESSTPSRLSDCEASGSPRKILPQESSPHAHQDLAEIEAKLQPITQLQKENSEKLRNIQTVVVQLAREKDRGIFLQTRDWVILALVLLLQTIFQWLFR